jgi:hypothetical protein
MRSSGVTTMVWFCGDIFDILTAVPWYAVPKNKHVLLPKGYELLYLMA